MTDTEVSREVPAAGKRLAPRRGPPAPSMADIAEEAGITRVTLYRRGETRPAIVAALRDELLREERELLLPLLAAGGDAGTRLTGVLEGVCETTESRADLLAGLDDAALNAIWHDEGPDALTRSEFIAPIVRLLRDGELDGSLRTFPDPRLAATVLYTQVTYTYLHLRREHGWTAEDTTAAVIGLAVGGLLP